MTVHKMSRQASYETEKPAGKTQRLGGEERRLMHLVPAPAVRLMKRQVLSRPGVNSL